MKIGIFGGSFDPVHIGHLLLAEQAREAASLDQVRFIPAAIPPNKLDKKLTDPQRRIEMLKLAIAGHTYFEVDSREIDREGISYTVDTLTELRTEFAGEDLFLLIGADSLSDFHTWKAPDQICQLAMPLIVRRPPMEQIEFELLAPYVDSNRLEEIRSHSFDSIQLEISSSDLRERVGHDRSIRFRTPRGVEEYIFAHKLYSAQ